MRSYSERFTDWLIAWRAPLLLLGIAMTAAAVVPSRSLHFDRSIETMFARDDPLLEPYEKLKRTFGGNEVVVAVYRDENLFAPDGSGIRRVAELSRKLERVPGVKDVFGVDRPLALAGGNQLVAERVRELFEGYTHGADGEAAAVLCLLEPKSATQTSRSETIRRLREVMNREPLGMITGEPVMVVDGFDYVQRDGRVLGWATTVLLGLVIVLSFRSLRWVIIPLAVVEMTVLLTQATLVWSGMQLSMVSSMLTAIVTVVGVATVVHVIVRFRHARRAGASPPEALRQAGPLLVVPVLLACATDAVGFSSLLLSGVGPIRDFGLMMAIGALFVLVSVALVVPGLALAGRFDTDPKRAWGEGRLDVELDRAIRWARRRRWTIAMAALAVSVAAVAGASRLEVETDFTKNFRADSNIVRSYQFVETHLGGAGVWDVILPAPAELDWDYLSRVRRLEDRLRDEVRVVGPDGVVEPGLTKLLSLADVAVAGSPVDLDSIPIQSVQNAALGAGLRKLEAALPTFVAALHGDDPAAPGQYYARIMLRAKERQPARQKLDLIRQVADISREEFPADDGSPGAEVTGYFVLLTNLIRSIIRDQWLTFAAATAGIGLMLWVAFRSPVLAIVGLVPNILPILVVTGVMGWLGLKINMGAAMIAAASIGLSIDSSIHYIIGFRRGLAEGKSVHDALADVQQNVGRAVVFSTVALIVGFMALVTSQFVPTIYFGVLVSLTMAGGVVGNLVLLPLLLAWVVKNNMREIAGS